MVVFPLDCYLLSCSQMDADMYFSVLLFVALNVRPFRLARMAGNVNSFTTELLGILDLAL